ncbi:hypothetical protein ACHQM5_007567 [Ranunculus cassubicifolius]
MSKLPPCPNNDVFTSVISDIKKYKGNDPLLPWIQGIKKIRESLSPQLLKEKLPRFLQKCALTFQADKKYRNDLRYVRVWIRLMDFVDDPRALFKTMEKNHIGTKQALFYQAYAMYLTKLKKFEEADSMYHLGVHNLAEPAGELQKSYEQFLRHMEQYKKKKTRHQERRAATASKHTHSPELEIKETKQDPDRTKGEPSTDETTVFKFVDTAIVGKSETEDACHHGLVDPTINMKEAMNAINNMFKEPIEHESLYRKKSHKSSSGFQVFRDEDIDSRVSTKHQNETQSPPQETFKIFSDNDDENESGDGGNYPNAFVFPRPDDDSDVHNSPVKKFREDTVVGRFVGSAILDGPEVENACHHGLVDPTVNLKEAMDDINSMFGKPLDFVKTNKSKKPGKVAEKKQGFGGFSILADDESKPHLPLPPLAPRTSSYLSSKPGGGCDLFEPTIDTKKAMDDINDMFSMPLDF